MPTLYNLSSITPDFDGIRAQVETALRQDPIWAGSEKSPVVNTLLDILASIGTLSQHKILRAIQDAFPETAVSDRAIYACQDFLGIRVPRKIPATAPAMLTSTESVLVPAYTQFQSSGTYFFNREPFTLTPGQPREVPLYQGQVIRFVTSGLGTDFQLYSPPDTSFSVSDLDVEVRINGAVVPRTTSGLWNHEGESVWQDRTLPDGRLLINFGSSTFGVSPLTTDTVEITYAVTLGAAGNSVTTLDNLVTTDFASEISGQFTSNPSGGNNEPGAQLLKVMQAPVFGTFDSAVTGRQKRSLVVNYPGILDAKTFSQREVNPLALKWFNLIRVVILADATWNATKELAFLEYLQSKFLENSRVVLAQAVPQSIDVEVNIYYYNYVSLEDSKAAAEDALRAFFTPRRGIIDLDVFRSDLTDVIKSSSTAIDYFELINPSQEVVRIKREPASAPTVTTTLTGVLEEARSLYGLAVTYADGSVTVKNWVEVNHPDNASNHIEWEPVPGAVSYQLYVDSETRSGLLTSVSAGSPLEFEDDGTATLGAEAPSFNTAPTLYPSLGNLNVRTFYTSRRMGGK